MLDTIDVMEERAEAIGSTVEFLYQDITEADETTIRAMIVLGGTDDQITHSLGIAAVNTRVPREDKSRYAYGCLRNIMMEDTHLPNPDESDVLE